MWGPAISKKTVKESYPKKLQKHNVDVKAGKVGRKKVVNVKNYDFIR